MITIIAKLSNHCNNKPYNDITKDELVSFLDSLRKPETVDPLHKWIGTYNNYLILISRFFKWLYNPDLPQKDRPNPEVIQNIPKLKRKEKSIYKPTDLWTNEDDQLFLSYCQSKRDKCYHMIARDTSCRPHEILGLRMKDIVFKMANDRQYAEVQVNGKTGTRSVPLINSIPYVKDYLDEHPQKNNPNAYFIFGNFKSYGKKLSPEAIYCVYSNYQKVFFPKLLQDPKISPEDKVKIKELLQKPWNPYIRRHTGLTEKSQILKESVLRQYAGWSINSNMPKVY
jgi:integrase